MSDLTSVSDPLSPIEVLEMRRSYVQRTLDGATAATEARLAELRAEIFALSNAMSILEFSKAPNRRTE